MKNTGIWHLIEALALAATRERRLLHFLLMFFDKETFVLEKPNDRAVLRRCLDELEYLGILSRRQLKGGRTLYKRKIELSSGLRELIWELAEIGVGYKYALCVLFALREGEPLNNKQIYKIIRGMDIDDRPSEASMDDSIELLRRARITRNNVAAPVIDEEWQKKLNAPVATA